MVPSEPDPLHGTILLLEDEPAVLHSTTRMLEKLGCTVLAVSDPQEALAIGKRLGSKIDLLISDVVMPSMNGQELGRLLRESNPQLPILFMSGYNADIVGPNGVLHEGISFIGKPFRMHDLEAKVRQLIQLEW
ncbi:MAG: response regulator [Kiritimatiellia bacterium]